MVRLALFEIGTKRSNGPSHVTGQMDHTCKGQWRSAHVNSFHFQFTGSCKYVLVFNFL